MITIRPFNSSDIPAGLELCRIAGWNQLEADWKRLLVIQPDGVFVAESDGKVCGTASAVCYGDRVAWIGMILVHPDFRGKGIGSQLMRACIDFLRPRVKTIKLDATDQGRPVYLKLGFKDERPIWRVARQAATADMGATAAVVCRRASVQCAVEQISPDHWPEIASIDAVAFGADRLSLLKALKDEGVSAVAQRDGKVEAYGFVRKGFNAFHLGPIVGKDNHAAGEVVASLLAGAAGKVFWDIMPENAEAMGLAQSLGFEPVRKLTRMYLGDEPFPGDPQAIYAGAGFELG